VLSCNNDTIVVEFLLLTYLFTYYINYFFLQMKIISSLYASTLRIKFLNYMHLYRLFRLKVKCMSLFRCVFDGKNSYLKAVIDLHSMLIYCLTYLKVSDTFHV